MLIFLVSLVAGLKLPLHPIETHIQLKDPSDLQYVFNYYNSYYYTVLAIGTPAVNFTLLIDTGSSYLWVPSYSCEDCSRAFHYYDENNSSSSTNLNQEKILKYSEANVTGQAYLEKVSTGDSQIANQVLIYSVVKAEGLSYLPSDGMLGLGFSNKLGGYLNLADQLKSDGVIQNSTFSIYFNDNIMGTMSETNPEANIIFGGYDMKYAQEDFRYVSIFKQSGFWFTTLNAVQVDDKNLTIESNYAIFHTGSPMIRGPKKDVEVFQNYTSQGSSCYSFNGYRVCSCKEYSKYPVFKFVIGGKVFELGPEHYIAKISGWCMALFQEIEGVEVVVLGLPFLRKYYATYNLDKALVGLALATKSEVIVVIESGVNVVALGVVALGIACVVGLKRYSKNIYGDSYYLKI